MPHDALSVDPELSLRWLTHARRGVLLLQLALMGLAEVGTGLHLHSPALIAVLALLLLADRVESRLAPSERLVAAHAIFDLLALTGVVSLSGGPSNPLGSAYLVYVALLAIVLPQRAARAAVVLVVLLQIVVVLHPGERLGLPKEELPAGHLAGHVVANGLAAIAVGWFVGRVSRALEARKQAEQRAALSERLAALGTLAAGVAHEIGTPLGTIQLAAEELRERSSSEEIEEILTQVERCRGILDRLRGRERSAEGACLADVGQWAIEWGRSSPDVEIVLRQGAAPLVAGAPESWRAAVWTALDNARRAGARRVEIELKEQQDTVEITLRDDGSGLQSQSPGRPGEPFYSGWGGMGLGLFVARSFAQSVGGDVALGPCEGGGAVVTLTMMRAQR